MSELLGRDVLSLKTINRKEMEQIFGLSDRMDTRKRYDTLREKILAVLFFESSTRTRLSFEASMHRLSGAVIGWSDPSSSRAGSASHSETIEDTVRMVNNYADAMVMRHPVCGAPALAAKFAKIPVINAGDGEDPDSEHPTQGLIDIYAIKRIKGSIDGLKIALAGNLKHMRCLHSDAYGLANFDVDLILVSPEELKMPQTITDYLRQKNVRFRETTDLDKSMSESDVLLVDDFLHVGFPEFSHSDRLRMLRLKDYYTIDAKKIRKAKQGLAILNPLPRSSDLGWDITPEIDDTPFAKYFEQASYGMNVRMALLSLLLQN